MALDAGFIKREPRKIDISKFLDIICLTAVQGAPSYNDLATRFFALYDISASKQAFWKKVNEECVVFFKSVLELLIQKRYKHMDIQSIKNSATFKRVIVQDSTIIKLPLRLFSVFSGVSNAHKAVCNARIQCVYELLSGSFLHFSIDPYSKNDRAAASELEIQDGDLVLRDRGYSTYDEFQRHIKAKADCIYRHNFKSLYLDPDTYKPIDLKKLLVSKGQLDIQVCLNNKERTKVRLIAEPVDEQVANQRRRKAKKDMKGHRPSKDILFLMSWSIFITTIPAEKANFKKIMKIYSLRWKIEIIFKIMKSHMCLTKLHNVSFNQLQVLLIARFIVMTLSIHNIYQPYYLLIKNQFKKYLSMGKFIKYILKNPECFQKIIIETLKPDTNELFIINQLARYCTYDKRKRLNFLQQLTVLSLS